MTARARDNSGAMYRIIDYDGEHNEEVYWGYNIKENPSKGFTLYQSDVEILALEEPPLREEDAPVTQEGQHAPDDVEGDQEPHVTQWNQPMGDELYQHLPLEGQDASPTVMDGFFDDTVIDGFFDGNKFKELKLCTDHKLNELALQLLYDVITQAGDMGPLLKYDKAIEHDLHGRSCMHIL